MEISKLPGFLARRLVKAVLVVLAIVICNFFLVHAAPGDPASVMAGQAGADSARVGRASDATLRSRIGRNHLAGGVNSSTWRRTLQAVLAASSPAQLTSWMHAHLTLIAVPVPDGGTLLTAERAVLEQLDPPLNLLGMPLSATRRALRELRRQL